MKTDNAPQRVARARIKTSFGYPVAAWTGLGEPTILSRRTVRAKAPAQRLGFYFWKITRKLWSVRRGNQCAPFATKDSAEWLLKRLNDCVGLQEQDAEWAYWSREYVKSGRRVPR